MLLATTYGRQLTVPIVLDRRIILFLIAFGCTCVVSPFLVGVLASLVVLVVVWFGPSSRPSIGDVSHEETMSQFAEAFCDSRDAEVGGGWRLRELRRRSLETAICDDHVPLTRASTAGRSTASHSWC